MKHTRKLLLIMAVMLSLMLAVGGTMAYLQDTDEDVNVMTLGNVFIEQLEYERVDVSDHSEDAELQPFTDGKPLYPAVLADLENFGWTSKDGVEQNEAPINLREIVPDTTKNIWDTDKINNEVDKMVFVKNTGKSPAYIRTWGAFEAGNMTKEQMLQKFHILANEVDWDVWEALEKSEIVNIGDVNYLVVCVNYTRNNGILQPGEVSKPSLLQYALDPSATNEDITALGDTYEILVISQAVQTEGFSDAETALNEAFGTEHPFADDMVQKDKEEQDYLASHPVEYNGERYATLQEGIDLAAQNGGGTVYVHGPINVEKTVVIPANLEVTIDGMGKAITRTQECELFMLQVEAGAKLTMQEIIVDGGAVWSGEVDETLMRPTTNTGVTAQAGMIANFGTVVLEEGTVLQNNDGGSAVVMADTANLSVNGAHLVDNNAAGGGAIYGGGTIVVNEGSKLNGNSAGIGGAFRPTSKLKSFTMNGGEMNHNKATGNGGAVYVYGGTLNFNGGEVAYNTANGTGGAIYADLAFKLNIDDTFSMHANKAITSINAVRFVQHSSFTMTGGEIKDNDYNGQAAFHLYNVSMALTGGTFSEEINYDGGVGLTVGEADIDEVIHFDLSTNHNTAYLADKFNGFSFTVNESAVNFSNFNFKPADGYTYINGDENKLVCLNEGYETYWDSNSKLFKLQAK